MCHALLHDPKFLALLLRIDHDLAAQMRAEGCACGGALHRADYPRKPRGCPLEVRHEHSSRLSFCCSVCRRRSTSMSVRFLARRVYLALAVVRLGAALGVQRRTLARWRAWWHEQFAQTPLWRATCARFMPPVPEGQLPGALIERFAGAPAEALMRLLVWLSPLTVGRGQGAAIRLHEVR